METLILSEALGRAVTDATRYHKNQVRKATQIPYISHLLAVCSLVLEAEGTETEAIAALLHDAPEDCGGEVVLKAITLNFGEDVGDIVLNCSDALPAPGEQKGPWVERKRAYIEHLKTCDASVLLVSAADKLHNLQSIEKEFEKSGDTVWERFNCPEDKKVNTLGYYRQLLEIYEDPNSAADTRREKISRPMRKTLNRLVNNPEEKQRSEHEIFGGPVVKALKEFGVEFNGTEDGKVVLTVPEIMTGGTLKPEFGEKIQEVLRTTGESARLKAMGMAEFILRQK